MAPPSMCALLTLVASAGAASAGARPLRLAAGRPSRLAARMSSPAAAAAASGKTVRVGVVGASGYTGAELVRLLLTHPQAEIAFLSADRSAGKAYAEVYPQFAHLKGLPPLVKLEDASFESVDVVFACLPHVRAPRARRALASRGTLVGWRVCTRGRRAEIVRARVRLLTKKRLPARPSPLRALRPCHTSWWRPCR